jgi:hypothetical protein
VSRYLLLVLLNIPLVLVALISTLVDFKLGKSSTRKFIFQTFVWLTIIIGLLVVKPVYEFLFSHGLTQTEPLSLFDVVQITGIIITLFIANRSRVKVERLERKIQDLHQELAIKLSNYK